MFHFPVSATDTATMGQQNISLRLSYNSGNMETVTIDTSRYYKMPGSQG